MKRKAVGFFDTEELRDGEETIRVKVLETIPWSAYPIMESPDQAIPKNSIISLPLWLVWHLVSSSHVIPLLPKPYSPSFRHTLQAGAANVRLPHYGRRFYSIGLKISEWWPNLGVPHLLFESFRGRLELIYRFNASSSSHNHALYQETLVNSDGSDSLLDRLDENEIEIYKTCVEQKKLFEKWVSSK
jgi:hypothetical protein